MVDLFAPGHIAAIQPVQESFHAAREEIRSRESVQAVESFRLLLGAPSGVDGVAGALACSSSSPGAGIGRLFASLCFV